MKRRNGLPRKRVDATKGSRGKPHAWHNIKGETFEPRQQREISSTAEIIEENTSSEAFVQCHYCAERSRPGRVPCRCGKKLGGLTALQEKNAQVTCEKGCQIIQSLVQLRIAEQVRRGQHGTLERSKILGNDARAYPNMQKERSR